jgi:iron(III) transport system permease protein
MAANALSTPARRRVVPGLGQPTPLTVAGAIIAGLLMVPVLTVLGSLLLPAEGVWVELLAIALPRYLANTAWLVAGVGTGVFVIGVGAAWLVTMCRFPGSRLLEWGLVLPMACPAYVVAYAYTDLLQFVGPVQTALREWSGWRRGDYFFPEIRSLGGAIFVLVFVLYPYVYLLSRAAFLEGSARMLEAGRTLGRSPRACFVELALPLARPAIVAGVALALMETLADFGTVQYFEVDTFTTGIFLTWFNLGSPVGAGKLAAGLLLVVLLVLWLERLSRGERRHHAATPGDRPPTALPLRGVRAALALAACALPVLFGFLVPVGVWLHLTLSGGYRALGTGFPRLILNSFTLALLASLLAVVVAAVLAYGVRTSPNRPARLSARLATMGYAVPGSVIAVGIMLPFGWFDNAVDAWARTTVGVSTGLLLSGTIFALLFSYLVRFLAVSFNAVESGLTRIRPSMDESARTLGQGPLGTLLRVHVPILRGSLLTAALLVFVEVVKELPATLIVRPFNFDTLAVRVYRLATDERLMEASAPALAIVAVGIIPVILLSTAITHSRQAPSFNAAPPVRPEPVEGLVSAGYVATTGR